MKIITKKDLLKANFVLMTFAIVCFTVGYWSTPQIPELQTLGWVFCGMQFGTFVGIISTKE